MKSRRFLIVTGITLMLFLFSFMQAEASAAAPSAELQNNCSKALADLGLMKTSVKGSPGIKAKMKRYEFIMLLSSAMSLDTSTDPNDLGISFKDLSSKHKGYREIITAASQGIIEAYGDNTIRPDKYITEDEALVMILKALGYDTSDNKKDAFGENLDKAVSIGLAKDCEMSSGTQLTRGKAAVIIYNALTTDYAVD